MENEEFEDNENILTLENPVKDNSKFALHEFPECNEFIDFNNYIDDIDNSLVSNFLLLCYYFL